MVGNSHFTRLITARVDASCPLCHGNVNGAATVDVGEAVGEVGPEFDYADVANVNRRPEPVRTGAFINSSKSLPIEALTEAMSLKSPIRQVTRRWIEVARLMAMIASRATSRTSASVPDQLHHECSLACAERWGSQTPGRLAKSGRTRVTAISCISATLRVGLEKTS
jgi:hypothetical protein